MNLFNDMKPVQSLLRELKIKRIFNAFDSSILTVLIVVFFIFHAAWVAISFQYPLVFDERYHYGIIEIFSKQTKPFIVNQPEEYDHLRDLTNEVPLYYHYILSIPLKILTALDANFYEKIISLRFINISFFAIGLFGYWKLLCSAGVKGRFVNLGLLVFTSLPLSSFVAATINYDNLLFALTPFYLWACIAVFRSDKLHIPGIAAVVGLGLAASLVKYTFLPLFAATVLTLTVRLIAKGHLSNALSGMKKYLINSKFRTILTVMLICALLGLFSAFYIKNIIMFGAVSPKCEVTLGEDRCKKSDIVQRNIQVAQTKDQRGTVRVADYSIRWFNTMWHGVAAPATRSSADSKSAPVIYYNFLFFALIIGAVCVFLKHAPIVQNRPLLFLVGAALVMIIAVFIFNILSYYRLHQALANQARYIMPALPILSVLCVYGVAMVLSKFNQKIKLGILIAVITLTFQGYGMTTHLLAAKPGDYWPDTNLKSFNNWSKETIAPYVDQY